MLKTRCISVITGALNDVIGLRAVVRTGDLRMSSTKCQLYSTAKMVSAAQHNYTLSHSVIAASRTLLPSCQDYRTHQRNLHSSMARNAKKHRSSKIDDSEIHEDDLMEDLEDELSQGEKIMNTRLSTDRLDAVMKTGFQLSRNKIEKALYKDLIRVNGQRPVKKSQLIGEGDEIDLILRHNKNNPAFLDINRLTILHLGQYSRLEDEDSDDEAKLPARIKRTRNLTIDNYEVPVKGSIEPL